ncbi:MAG TPA: hypothetical protein VNN79_04005 [Actinomycetota bacterium]|nr:hypothetical protein [Actinomycetota bacterium]
MGGETVVRDGSDLQGDVAAWVPRLALALGAVGLAAALVTGWLSFLNRSAIHTLDEADIADIVLPVGFSLIGALLAARRPRNPIGWMFLAMAVVLGFDGVSHEYVLHGTHLGRLPFVQWVAWTHDWTNWLVFPAGLATFFYLLFPDGRLQSRGWRWVAGFAGVLVVFGAVVFALEPTIELQGAPSIRNPIGWRVLDPNGSLGLIWLVAIVVILVAMVGTVLRTRRATGELRLQLRWLSFVTVLTVVALGVVTLLELTVLPNDPVLFPLVILLGYGLAMPITCGIAILKYRLYDIDRIIRRTALYGVLTAILVAIYAVLVVGIGSALGNTNDPLLIAGATLLVAALVRPLRRRIQAFLDRRFARRRYDAAGVLATFSARLRDEIDLDDVRGLLQGAVVDTVRPARVGIWLKEGSASKA